MKRAPLLTMFSLFSLLCLVASIAHGQEEQNGLQVEVTRKTMSRNDERNNTFYYNQQIDRTMALHVVVKNVSMDAMPAGEIDYSLLVHKVDYFPHRTELYTGVEKLPALKPAETADVVLGSAQINGYRDVAEQHKDKLDYQVVIKHNGKETAKVSNIEGFDAQAQSAVKMTPGKK